MKERATVICRRDDRVLYVRRSKSSWVLPGGKIEAGETPAQAALRELCEETGLVAQGLVYLARFENDNTVHYVFAAALRETDNPTPCNEIANCKWLPFKKVRNLNVTPAAKTIVRSFAREAV
ncbi:NUDIX hydrolase [Pseudomonas sp. NA-150]|uniref:NUDIX hydrolase n=1 Tax=Pseudomonas sp. NA-150 TaxID=3367525 RepID=UPI0037C4FAB0